MTDVAAGGVGTVFVAEKDALRVAADLRSQGFTTQIVEDFVVKTDDPIWAYRSVRVTVPLRPGEQPWSSNANPSGVYDWYMSTGAILSHAAALLEVSRTAITADIAKEVTQRFTLEPTSRPPLHSRTSTTSSAGEASLALLAAAQRFGAGDRIARSVTSGWATADDAVELVYCLRRFALAPEVTSWLERYAPGLLEQARDAEEKRRATPPSTAEDVDAARQRSAQYADDARKRATDAARAEAEAADARRRAAATAASEERAEAKEAAAERKEKRQKRKDHWSGSPDGGTVLHVGSTFFWGDSSAHSILMEMDSGHLVRLLDFWTGLSKGDRHHIPWSAGYERSDSGSDGDVITVYSALPI